MEMSRRSRGTRPCLKEGVNGINRDVWIVSEDKRILSVGRGAGTIQYGRETKPQRRDNTSYILGERGREYKRKRSGRHRPLNGEHPDTREEMKIQAPREKQKGYFFGRARGRGDLGEKK